MAKSKKSKILAMALCASVMTGIYAAPVMADNVNASFDSSSGNIVFKIAGDTYTINKDDITKAIERNRIHSNGSVTANAGFIARSGYYAIVGDTQYAMLANKEYFALGDDLRMNAQDNEKRASFYVDNATGNVTTKGDVTTLNGDGTVNYSLNTIGANTAGIVRSGETTTIEKTVSVDKWGLKVLDENGETVASINSTNGGINAANDKFHVWSDGAIEGTALSLRNNGAQNVYIGNSGTARFGAENGNNVRIENGVLYVNRNKEQLAALGENGLTLTSSNNIGATLDAAQLANINSVIGEGGVVNGADGSVIGGVRFSGGGDLNNVNHINGALIEAYDADPDNGVSGLRISGVAMENGAIKVNAINGATVNYYGEGGLEISGVGMLNGDVSAQTFNGVSIEKDTDGSAVIGGIDIGNLNENVAAATKNIAGIKRTDSNNDGIDDTTTIENRVSIGRDKFTISGYGDDSFTMDSTAARFAGDVFFNNGYRAKFTYANGTTSLGDLAYNLDDLTAQVNDIYNRTQGIDRDANGNTVISNDGRTWENGTSTVTDNDGATVTVGEDVTIDGGNLNVNNGDLNVGTSGEGGSGSGEGGSTGGNGGNGNFSSDINVGGNANVNGTVTVGDASDGKYTQVGESGMTIVGKDENNNTTTNNISDKGMTVTGENGTNNISDSGMTITGKDGNTSNNISDKGMTVTGSNGTTNISGGDISVDNSVTVAGGSENKTTINNEGITVGDKGTSIKNDSISVGDGGYIGDGDVRSGEGVSLNQTAERVGHLENRVGELEDRIDKVGAMAAAIANLRTMGYDPAAPTEVAVGIGQYRDETGAALGLFHYPNRDFMLSLSVSTSGDEVMGGIGATWKFGRKSPEKVAEIKKAQAEADARRAEEAKLAKAEEMKQAAKEAKIKAQQERHAKLAAERAAQAEAAK